MILTQKAFKELIAILTAKAEMFMIIEDWGGQKHLLWNGYDITHFTHPDENQNVKEE